MPVMVVLAAGVILVAVPVTLVELVPLATPVAVVLVRLRVAQALRATLGPTAMPVIPALMALVQMLVRLVVPVMPGLMELLVIPARLVRALQAEMPVLSTLVERAIRGLLPRPTILLPLRFTPFSRFLLQ